MHSILGVIDISEHLGRQCVGPVSKLYQLLSHIVVFHWTWFLNAWKFILFPFRPEKSYKIYTCCGKAAKPAKRRRGLHRVLHVYEG
jgi:hypothetical protein